MATFVRGYVTFCVFCEKPFPEEVTEKLGKITKLAYEL